MITADADADADAAARRPPPLYPPDKRRKGRGPCWVRAVEVRGGHVGSEEHRAHEILAGAGPHAALVLGLLQGPARRIRWSPRLRPTMRKGSWDGSLTEFLATLDPGSAHDWVRVAVGEPSGTKR